MRQTVAEHAHITRWIKLRDLLEQSKVTLDGLPAIHLGALMNVLNSAFGCNASKRPSNNDLDIVEAWLKSRGHTVDELRPAAKRP